MPQSHALDLLAHLPWPAYQIRRRGAEDYVLEYVSPAAEALYELPPGTLTIARYLERTHPEDLPGLLEAFERGAGDLQPATLELRILVPSGVRWVETSFVPRVDHDGLVIFQGIGHEVTARRRVEADLRASEALTRQLLEDTPLQLAMFDRDLNYVAYSRAWLTEFGRGRRDLHGLNHYEVVPDLPERWREVHRRALEGERVSAAEDGWELPDGTVRWLRWEVQPWRDGAGAVAGFIVFSEDITERKRESEARLALERRHRQLIELAPVAVFTHRAERLVLVNEAAGRLFESAPEALVGRSVWDLIPPEFREPAEARLERLRRGEDVPTMIARLQTVGGRPIHVEVSSARVPDPQGDTVLVVARDLRDQIRAERDAKELAERLRAIIESMMDGVVTVDDQGLIVVTNSAAEAMFGYAPGQLVGRSLEELIPPASRSSHRAAMGAFAQSGAAPRAMRTSETAQLDGLRADGTTFPTETTISKVLVAGRPLYTAIHRDIGPRLEMEGALDAERRRFEQLAESIREVFWLAEADTGQLLYVSPAYETIWGRSCQSALRSSDAWLEGVHPEDRDHVRAALPLQAEGRFDVEYRVVRPDGSVGWVHDRAFPVRGSRGEVVRIAGVAEEITGRRSLEEQVRQTQRLESLALLAGGVAHDFNNLLTIVTSAVEVLREDARPGDRELLDDILAAGERGATLTRQLLAFTRQEVVSPRVMSLSAIVEDARRLLVRLIGEDIRFVTHFASRGLVRVDPGQWSQVVLNLAVNARDAMPEGGMLRISTRSIEADAALAARHRGLAKGRWEVLEVADDGAGMTPEVRARIFEPFFTTKERGRGTGLGLSVVYGVVEQAGGVVEVDTALGRGTTFTIFLPAANGAVSERSARPLDRLRGSERVLIVEDEEMVRRVAARALRAYGYDTSCAPDGPTALRMVDEHGPPALVVSDVVMPGMDGATLAQQLRARHPTLKVLLTSGYMDDALRRRGVDPLDVAFLQKPYSPQTLAARVREVLDG